MFGQKKTTSDPRYTDQFCFDSLLQSTSSEKKIVKMIFKQFGNFFLKTSRRFPRITRNYFVQASTLHTVYGWISSKLLLKEGKSGVIELGRCI